MCGLMKEKIPEMSKSHRMQNTCMIFVSFFLFCTTAISSPNQDDRMPPRRCSPDGPEIRFPFWIKSQQSELCGYPGFEVYCDATSKTTILKLPFSGSFSVKYINYTSQTVNISDPGGCLPQRFLHLNLSTSPFNLAEPAQYKESVTVFNCSTQVTGRDFGEFITSSLVQCLSDSGNYVYAFSLPYTDANMLHLAFCKKIGDYSYQTSWNLFQSGWGFQSVYPSTSAYLQLVWSQPSCVSCETKGEYCRLKNTSTSEPQTECFIPPPTPLDTGRTTTTAIIGLTTGTFFSFVAIFLRIYSNKIETEYQVRLLKFLDDYKTLKPSRFTFADIKKITNQFKEKLGQGGYGTVYKGRLSGAILVAVKVFNNSTSNGEDFINEVGTIGTIHHKNVVRLVGFCADGYKRVLIYEFLLNESLEKFIFSKDTKRADLGWEKLKDIAIGIAKGVEYLHQGCDLRILHFDIKSHNILLDENFNPKISDFGLAKLFPKDESAVSMTAARGTIGYIAPEVFSRNFGHVSHKSDVYSFGIMLLEMVGGRKNIDNTVENNNEVYFSQWIYNHLSQGKELQIRIDEDGDAGIAKKLTIVALWCIQWYPVDRPSMKEVVQMLELRR